MSFQALVEFGRRQKLEKGVAIRIQRARLVEHLQDIASENESPFNIDEEVDREVHLFVTIRNWARRQLRGEYEFTWPSPDVLVGRFEKRKDAMLFKLTWG